VASCWKKITVNKESIFLLVAAVCLTPVALAYGLFPAVSVPMLYGVEIDTISIAHIFRAVMGLYLAMIVFWILGSRRESLRFAALCSVVVFMGGLALGRLLSIFFDGIPEPLLVVYLPLELGFALVGLRMAMARSRDGLAVRTP
jgi:hypothetical protein